MKSQDSNLLAKFKKMGPAAIITSAFIGPGTLLTATVAGNKFGHSLLWVILLAVIALMILMEMAARIGIAGNSNMIDAATEILPGNKAWKLLVQILIVAATVGICFAFESGNITGASAGLADLFGGAISINTAAVIIAIVAVATIFLPSYKSLSRVMQVFVSIMALVFIITLFAVRPNVGHVAQGLFILSLPKGSAFNALGLVGTTLIGINLILHSITSGEKWAKKDVSAEELKVAVKEARFDILFNIIIGGIITLSIIIVAATVLHGKGVEIKAPVQFSQSLEPVLGSWARIVGDLGLFAAGLSSAIAIPFTLRSILSKALHTKDGYKNNGLRVLSLVVIGFALFLIFAKVAPLQIILFAQATSGLVLPFIASLLLIAANNKKIMKEYTNKAWQNIVGVFAVVLSFILGINGIISVVQRIIALANA